MTSNETEPHRRSHGGRKTRKFPFTVELAWGQQWWSHTGLGAIAILAFLGLLGYVIMFLWNQTIAVMFGLTEIGYWQAVGLFLLAKLFFGFGGGGHRTRGKRRGGKNRGHELNRLSRQQDFRKFWDQEGKQAYDDFASRQKNE